jgi:hypothetical protein
MDMCIIRNLPLLVGNLAQDMEMRCTSLLFFFFWFRLPLFCSISHYPTPNPISHSRLQDAPARRLIDHPRMRLDDHPSSLSCAARLLCFTTHTIQFTNHPISIPSPPRYTPNPYLYYCSGDIAALLLSPISLIPISLYVQRYSESFLASYVYRGFPKSKRQ